MSDPTTTEGRRSGRRRGGRADAPKRAVDYHRLRNPLPVATVFTEDRVEAMHATALRVLEELGVKVLLPEARALFRAAGARIDEASEMVFIGREIIEATLATAPRRFEMRAGVESKNIVFELGALTFQAGGGCPNVTDLVRGRRPGSIEAFDEVVRLVDAHDALQIFSALVEPQDVRAADRHYAQIRTMTTLSDKVPHIFSRGRAQLEDCFAMLQIARGVDEDAFRAAPYAYTIVNTNSPRQIDIPMAEGLIDMARWGQMSVVTPFCLMGAMAPVSIAGALVLSHAEALAAIALTQLAKPGAAVCYGAFISNVDMKSGAPAFGTPEQVKAALGAGQLARKLGLPWRCAAGCAANVNDAQAAHETQISTWASVLAGCTMVMHAAGWIEGGLTLSYEKLITDLEAMQVFAELCAPTPAEEADLAFDALAEVEPGGHFFAAQHTMERYQTAFYEPLIADWSNFGAWTERGSKDVSARATELWRQRLAEPAKIVTPEDRVAALDAFIARRIAEGGAPPVS